MKFFPKVVAGGLALGLVGLLGNNPQGAGQNSDSYDVTSQNNLAEQGSLQQAQFKTNETVALYWADPIPKDEQEKYWRWHEPLSDVIGFEVEWWVSGEQDPHNVKPVFVNRDGTNTYTIKGLPYNKLVGLARRLVYKGHTHHPSMSYTVAGRILEGPKDNTWSCTLLLFDNNSGINRKAVQNLRIVSESH